MSCGITINMHVSCQEQISTQDARKSPLTISRISGTYLTKDVWSSDGDEYGLSLYLFDMMDKNIFDHFQDISTCATSNGLFSLTRSIRDILQLDAHHGNLF